jgi:hypothetical protein
MTNHKIEKSIREIKELSKDIDEKVEYIIEKLSEMFYKR